MIIHDCDQNSDEWFALRVGIPTASEFKNIITSQGKAATGLGGYAATLAAEAYAEKPLERWAGNQWTERGHELEPEARATYEFLQDAEVTQAGFVTYIGAGCSPDGLVGDNGLVEIKCLSPKIHVQTLAYLAKHDKCPPDYYPQIQGQILICEREWCDVLFYHPDLPHRLLKVHRTDDFEAALREQLAEVITQRDNFIQMLEAA